MTLLIIKKYWSTLSTLLTIKSCDSTIRYVITLRVTICKASFYGTIKYFTRDSTFYINRTRPTKRDRIWSQIQGFHLSIKWNETGCNSRSIHDRNLVFVAFKILSSIWKVENSPILPSRQKLRGVPFHSIWYSGFHGQIIGILDYKIIP